MLQRSECVTRKVFMLLSVLAIAVPHYAHAANHSQAASSTSAEGLIRQFGVADFEQFAPQNALDIINRIPGFAVIEEDEQRGLGQATSNILINGARIAGKTNGVVTALSRIPLDAIVGIKIYEGASLAIPGLTGEVVDVVVVSKRLAGNWRWEMQHRDENDEVDPAYWKSNISMAGRIGTTSWNVGLDNDYRRLGYGGPETVFDGVGNVVEVRDEYATFDRDKTTLSVGFAFEPDSGNVGNLNMSYQNYWQGNLETRASNLPGGDQRFESGGKQWSAEISGDYRFSLADGYLKLIALQSYEYSPDRAIRFALDNPEVDRRSSRRTDKTGESILRSEFDWLGKQNGGWQWSLEAAYNSFDRSLGSRNTGNLAFGIVALDNLDIDVKVEELRFETNLSYSRALSDKLLFQGSIGLENSNMEQTGDQLQERNFTREKGFISFAYQLNGLSNISLKLERSVGQLAFADFIASVDLDIGNNDAGNPDLVPPQSWRAELSLEQSLSRWGAITIKLTGEDIEDIVDRIPVANGDAVGNLDSAKRYGAEVAAAIELTPLGWRGARLEIDGIFNRSEIDDPITGQQRRINYELIRDVTFELRHDVPNTFWAWGISYRLERFSKTFRLNQTNEIVQNRGLAFPFIEHKNLFGLTARFKVRNFDDRMDIEERRFYTPRRDGMLTGIERRERTFGNIYILELFGSF